MGITWSCQAAYAHNRWLELVRTWQKPRHEESNPRLKALFLEIVDNQLNSNSPPETRQTFDRLIAEGFSREDAKIYIAQAVCLEVFTGLKHKTPYDNDKYLRNLEHLPKEPQV